MHEFTSLLTVNLFIHFHCAKLVNKLQSIMLQTSEWCWNGKSTYFSAVVQRLKLLKCKLTGSKPFEMFLTGRNNCCGIVDGKAANNFTILSPFQSPLRKLEMGLFSTYISHTLRLFLCKTFGDTLIWKKFGIQYIFLVCCATYNVLWGLDHVPTQNPHVWIIKNFKRSITKTPAFVLKISSEDKAKNCLFKFQYFFSVNRKILNLFFVNLFPYFFNNFHSR